jgi:hypothetical protein
MLAKNFDTGSQTLSEEEKTPPVSEVTLPDDQATGLREMHGWSKNANAELGVAYLRYEVAKREFDAADRNLRGCSDTAKASARQYQDLLAKVADMNSLPDGEWMYDGDRKLKRSK